MKRVVHHVRSLAISLWTLIVPPTVWAGHFLFSYLWAALHCAKIGSLSRFPTLYAIGTAAALLLILAAGAVAFVQSRSPGGPAPHDEGTKSDRDRFLAKSTLLLAGLSFIAVVFTAAPVAILTDCR